MKKEFVEYKEALALKEIGFDEPCYNYYDDDNERNIFKLSPYLHTIGIKQSERTKNKGLENSVSAPLLQQSFRFFRDKYNLSSSIELTDNSRHYYYDFTIYDSENRDYNDEDCFDSCKKIYDDRKFSSYEEAELACLKRLIEIAKKNEK